MLLNQYSIQKNKIIKHGWNQECSSYEIYWEIIAKFSNVIKTSINGEAVSIQLLVMSFWQIYHNLNYVSVNIIHEILH